MSKMVKRDWYEVPANPTLEALSPGVRVFYKDLSLGGFLTVLVSHDGPNGWHMSISHKMIATNAPGRYPTWDEIKDARYRFVPDDVHMAMILPPSSEYVNVHATTFHLHQIESDGPDIARWYRAVGEAVGESGSERG